MPQIYIAHRGIRLRRLKHIVNIGHIEGISNAADLHSSHRDSPAADDDAKVEFDNAYFVYSELKL